MAKKPILLANPPLVAILAAQKSCGKTHLAAFLADMLAVNGQPFRAFQIDDQKRLSHMIGDTVVDLRPDPDLLVEDPTLSTRAITPFYDACREATAAKVSVLLDTGANEGEHLSNFLRDVGFAEDIAAWRLPVLAFVPYFALDPESTAQSAFTVRRLREAVPNLRVVLVENRFGGAAERIVPGSIAETSHQDLLRAAAGVERIVMPAIAREYWAPFEGAGIRFIKALAMDPAEGAQQLGRSVGEVKVMKSNVARFWRAMHTQLAQIIALPEGGA